MIREGALAALLLSVHPVAAQDIDCEDSAAPATQTQMGMNFCSYQDYQKADRALNLVWPQIKAKMKALDESNRDWMPEQANGEENLLKAQRAWIDYRDGHCTAEGAEYAGGSIRPLIENTCLAALTRHRTEELLLMLEEG
ncbi:MAG: lysozyme inhibitor LprI family protein [Pseudomonadota bacterium]